MKSKMALSKKGLNINTYGYDYSQTDFLLTLLAFVGGMVVICILHKLSVMYSVLVMLTMVCLTPLLVTSFFKYKHEKLKFEEYCKYFDYMKIYFKTYKKIKIALEYVEPLFPKKSHMRDCILKAINEINETGDYKKALGYIDEDYHNSYLERLHNLLITGETHGAESVYENMDMINFQEWKEDIRVHQNRKRSFRYMLYGMTIFSVALSYYGVVMFGDSINNLFIDPKYQLYTFANIEGIFILFICIYISLVNKKWVRSDD